MPPKRRRRDESGRQQGATGEGEEPSDGKYHAVRASMEEVLKGLEQEGQRAAGERAQLLAEAHEAAAKVTADAKSQAEERTRDAEKQIEDGMRDVEKSRAALEEEKATMEKAHTFQTSKMLLNVGGHRFETSRVTLTSIPDTYLESLFSGRFELTTDAEGAYFIDRDGRHFHHILNCLRDCGRFELSSDLTEGQRKELAVEVEFYGLLDHMMPYHAQELIGKAILQRACRAGTKSALQTAVAQVRELVFEMGSTTPFLTDEFQDTQWSITDRVVNGRPVWAATGGKWFMYHTSTNRTKISTEAGCTGGCDLSMCIYNVQVIADGAGAPTDLPSDKWLSLPSATLEAQYPSSRRINRNGWIFVPELRIAAVHGLDDGDPTMAAALRQLTALA